MNLASKIFIDGADPEETKAADDLLKKAGHVGVEGQTTNPTLIAKRVLAQWEARGETGGLSQKDALAFYRKTVEAIAQVTKGPISIQVLANAGTTVEQMVEQARARSQWIPNGVVKFPATHEGVAAASIFCQERPVNLTLTFSQEQAAAVYVATKESSFDIYVSPFVGRLDDRGDNGMAVVANILAMYRKLGDGHVKVLTASVRNVKHILYALWLKSDAITIPFNIIKQWADLGFLQPPNDFFYDSKGLTEIPYQELSLDRDWHTYQLHHPLTIAGVAQFWNDWYSMVL